MCGRMGSKCRQRAATHRAEDPDAREQHTHGLAVAGTQDPSCASSDAGGETDGKVYRFLIR